MTKGSRTAALCRLVWLLWWAQQDERFGDGVCTGTVAQVGALALLGRALLGCTFGARQEGGSACTWGHVPLPLGARCSGAKPQSQRSLPPGVHSSHSNSYAIGCIKRDIYAPPCLAQFFPIGRRVSVVLSLVVPPSVRDLSSHTAMLCRACSSLGRLGRSLSMARPGRG